MYTSLGQPDWRLSAYISPAQEYLKCHKVQVQASHINTIFSLKIQMKIFCMLIKADNGLTESDDSLKQSKPLKFIKLD